MDRAEVKRELLKLAKDKSIFECILAPLNKWEQAILRIRYANGVKWDCIIAHVPYSRRQAIYIHNRALDKIALMIAPSRTL